LAYLNHKTEKENKRLREEVANLKTMALFANIKHFEYEPGQIDLTMQTGVGRVLCDFTREILTQHNAPNFTSMTFRFCDTEEFYILVGRCSGKTIVEKYHQARREIDELKAEIQGLKGDEP